MSGDSSIKGLDVTLRDFVAGQKVFGRYTLIKILGRGGMGIVWLAHDEVLDRDVALKFLPEVIIHDRAVLEDLKRETKRSLELTHKNIIRIHDFVHDVISGCITMEYVEGDTLSNLRADKPSKIFEPDELKPWLRQLCEALDYAHDSARIVHRDLKPANLMISRRGELKIADFGIARSLSDSVSMLTQTHGTSGTLVYMSPQQLDGERGTHLDDIYSLGATIYELLTSKPPFYSGDIGRQIHDRIPPTMMQRRRDLEIEANPIPGNWEQTVAACLAKDPARRPQSVMDIAQRLGLTLSRPQAVVEPLKKRGKKATLVVVAVIACVVAAARWYFTVRQEKPLKTAEQKLEQKPTQLPTTIPAPSASVITTPAPSAVPTASAQIPAATLASDKDKVSYSLGLNIGLNFKKQKFDVNLEPLAAGVEDGAAAKKPVLTETEVREALARLNDHTNKDNATDAAEAKSVTAHYGGNEVWLKSMKDKASYSVGLNIGLNLRTQNVDLNTNSLVAGISDAIAGAPRMTEQEVRQTMMAFEKDMQEKQTELGKKNAAEAEKFLAENETKEGVKTTASGLQYKVLKQGTGAQPKTSDNVTVNYRGTLINGTEFDSSYKRGQPATFPVSGVIKGWNEALQLMKAGGKYQLFIPANLAYGEQGRPGIPPNSTLIFEVELTDVKSPQAGGASATPSPSAK